MTHEPEEGRAHATNVSPITEGPAGSKNADSSSQSQSDGDAPEFKSAELALVDRLIPELPPILCRAEDWVIYGNGIWAMRTRAHYMPEALAIQDPKHRNERMAGNVLPHIQGKFQVKESPFGGARKFDDGDTLWCVENGVLRIKPNPGELILEKFNPAHHFTQK